MDDVLKGHLPRLAPKHYCGHSFIHWTLTLEGRPTGWLSGSFHQHWQFFLLHTCARYDLVCPTYVLMPDHIHALLLGIDGQKSDQRVAIEFLRKNLRPLLPSCEWQHQSHDNVLREHDRERNAFAAVAHYLLENPVRAKLVRSWQDYAYAGHSVPGYPTLNLRDVRYWDLFWRIYHRLVDAGESTRSRS